MSYDSLTTLDYGDRGQVTIAANAEGVANLAVQTFATAMTTAWSLRGRAAIALSGGSTPKRMGELLAHSDFPAIDAWQSTDIFWGDERWVPLDNPESNAGVALETFLTKVPIPIEKIHPMYDPELDEAAAAAIYQALVEEIVEPVDGVPAFDLIFLGMGDDGHTASLFPYTKGLDIRDRLAAPNYVEKFDTTRLTFTTTLINGAREVVFLVTGSGKAARLKEVLEGPIEADRLPSQLIRPVHGSLRWLIDQGAASELSGGPFHA
ncbi:MAG: 6-phosphogluconolactonase [Thermomicrobiales bacterium]|nr:6-phosphogluconolactonase [Thermomicrobiales bacterium]